MKAKELIYNLRTNLAGAGSQLSVATDQHIQYMLDEARAVLASRKMEQKVNVVQFSQFVDLKPIEATKAQMGSIGTKKVLVVPIPPPISYSNGVGIFTVGPTDGQTSYTQITYSELQTCFARKYTSAEPKWFFMEHQLYLINVATEAVKLVRVRGIFDEPYKVEQAMKRFKYLKPFDYEYPLSMHDADAVYKLAMSGDLGWGDTAVASIEANKKKQQKSQEIVNALQGGKNQE
jgi:hypothetical protein